MPTYIGFSTKHINEVRPLVQPGLNSGINVMDTQLTSKKFRITDERVVIDDFINMLNLPQGQLPGRPEVGTTLWSFIFEPNTVDVRTELEKEIRRVASLDPRLILNQVIVYPNENGILLELEVAVAPFNNAMTINVALDAQTNKAYGT